MNPTTDLKLSECETLCAEGANEHPKTELR